MSSISLYLLAFYVCLISYSEAWMYSPKFVKYGVNGEFRIIGGKPADKGEFRAQVSLQNRFFAHICAGVIIDPVHIVTAAHCHQPQKRIGYVMGDDLMVTFNGSETRQRRKVMHFVPHPEFSRDTFQNDIAVIRVDNPFNVTKTFGPKRRSEATPTIETRCTVVGWGYTTNGQDGDISYNLLKTDVFVADINYCNSSDSYEGAMKPGMFCAGRLREGGHDACLGDSGGLITCGGLQEISGVVSFGNECGLPEFPGIYADVSMYNAWIDEIVATKVLPEYEFSPFPKPYAISQPDEDDSYGYSYSEVTSSSATLALISVFLAIRSVLNVNL